MHAVSLIAPCIPDEPLPEAAKEGICAVTGEVSECITRKAVFGSVLLNLDFLRAPSSHLVSVAVFKTMAYKWARMSSWFCDGHEFCRLDRQGVRDLVIGGNYPSVWVGYATTSYKKHGALYARVNNIKGQAVWRFENIDVDCSNRARLEALWKRLNAELRAGISRPVIETLEPTHYTFKAVGYARWLEFEKWARPLFRSALYQFLCYLLPSQEELKEELNRGSC